MVGKSFLHSTALAVLAAASALTALPAHAQDADGDRRGRGGGFERRVEAAQQRQERSAERAQAPQAQAAPRDNAAWQARTQERGGQAQAQAQAQARVEARQQRSAPDGGWRSRRAPAGQSDGGQRYGRNWDNNGAVSRPAPAWGGATPATPDRGVTDQARAERWGAESTGRNRTYSDPNRNGGYRDRNVQDGRNQTAQSWRDRRQGDRSGTYDYNTYRNGYRDGRSADNYRDRRDQGYAYRNGYNSAARDYRRWDRNDWRRDNRYNWSGYRNQHRNLYRVGRYYSPYSNYSYNRLSIGFFLDRGFYGQNYWINDPWQYRLPEVYGPYRWVRYYDDVLLVDIYSGEVVDVIHDFFW